MSNRFWVYVNEPNNKALVHQASCSHCNDGHGREDDKSPYNGEWLGPFDRQQAQTQARRADKKNTRWCGFCAKALGIDTKLEAQ